MAHIGIKGKLHGSTARQECYEPERSSNVSSFVLFRILFLKEGFLCITLEPVLELAGWP